MSKMRARTMAMLLSALLLLTTALVPVQAKVGVTSATNGEPTGTPPATVERILRIGIDLHADEIVRTNSSDRAHLVFLDGSSLTIGPNAVVKIDRFVYDPSQQKGEIAFAVSKGVIRFVGGKVSKTSDVIVKTPSTTIGIRGGIALVVVTDVQTDANFIYGLYMSVSSNGITTRATRPGSVIITTLGNAPSNAVLVGNGGLDEALSQLEGAGNSTALTAGADPDQLARGISTQNSGLGLGGQQPPTSPTGNNAGVNAVNNANNQQSVNAFAAAGTTAGLGGGGGGGGTGGGGGGFTPPGQLINAGAGGGTALPSQGGSAPGQSGSTPGQSGSSPGNGGGNPKSKKP